LLFACWCSDGSMLRRTALVRGRCAAPRPAMLEVSGVTQRAVRSIISVTVGMSLRRASLPSGIWNSLASVDATRRGIATGAVSVTRPTPTMRPVIPRAAEQSPHNAEVWLLAAQQRQLETGPYS
jgi:hypothetical protein